MKRPNRKSVNKRPHGRIKVKANDKAAKRNALPVRPERTMLASGEQAAVRPENSAPTGGHTAESGPVAAAIIKLKNGPANYRGARAKWYERLKAYDGKPLAEWLENCKEDCPQLTKQGGKEDPKGWWNFFKRQGVADLSNQ